MLPHVKARLRNFPIGFHSQTRSMVSPAEIGDALEGLTPLRDLSLDDQRRLVITRWRAGDWQEITHGAEGVVDLDRAEHEVMAGTSLGQQLLAVGLRAIEMHQEELQKEESRP